MSTPRRDLAPPIEEDEEPESESQGEGAPLRQIENNISALLRGDIPIARVTGMRISFSSFKITTWQTNIMFLNFASFFTLDIQPPRRPLGFRAGVHKSESAKEMLLSQHVFGALPPSPPESSADVSNVRDIDCQNSPFIVVSPTTSTFYAMIELIFISFRFFCSRKLMVFHHYHHCQRRAMPMCLRRKFVPTAIDQRHWEKNMKVDIVTQWKVHHPFHRIDAHPPKIRLKQCEQ